MDEKLIADIMRLINEQLFEPQIKWSRVEFQRRSYSRWAAYEILELLMNHPFSDSEMLIEDFIMKMIYCLYLAENNNKSDFMFVIAIDVAEDILFLCRG